MNAKILPFLEQNALKNIVLLKMLHAFPEAIESHFVERENAAGVLLLLQSQAYHYDAKTYPWSKFVVLLSSTGADATHHLLPFIPVDAPLVFKLMDDDTHAEIASHWQLQREMGVISYTASPDARFNRHDEVKVATAPGEELLAIYAEQGHPRRTVEEYFRQADARTFTIYGGGDVGSDAGGKVLSTCFVYLNYQSARNEQKSVWEIGGVWSDPAVRRNGYARKVVEQALGFLQQHQRLPRYQVHEENFPSIHLAERLGLTKFVTIEHFSYKK